MPRSCRSLCPAAKARRSSRATKGPAPKRPTDALAKLRPSFGADGTVTAGNASQISDGAAAVVVGDERTAAEHSLAADCTDRRHRNVRCAAQGDLHRPRNRDRESP